MSLRKTFQVGEEMIIFAFRYSLGRKGIAPELCSNYIIALWDSMTDEMKSQIKKEITVMAERGEAGGDAQIDQWARISRLL